jgi:pilus assembly protein CpaB
VSTLEKFAWLMNRTLWLAAAAIVIGACAYTLAHHYLKGQEEAVRERVGAHYATREALVAARELPAGSVLEPSMLARRAVPRRFLASDAVPAGSAADVLGRTLARPLSAGETVSLSALESQGAAALSTLIEPGLRALTIPVDDSSTAAGLLSPGDVVDLLLVTRGDDAGRGVPAVRPLLQAVRVVATGQRLQRHRPAGQAGQAGEEHEAAEQYQTVTLHVGAEDAERILLAQRLGELAVLLRREGDVEPASLPSMEPDALLGRNLTRRTAPGPDRVEFIVGGGTPARVRGSTP